jgi:hypothetical protein
MWKTLVNLVKRCLRTVRRKPVARQETCVQNPPAEMTEAQLNAYLQAALEEVKELLARWKAGTLPPHWYRKPPKRKPRQKTKRVARRPDSVRKTPGFPTPRGHRAPMRKAPTPPKFLRPLPFDSPFF